MVGLCSILLRNFLLNMHLETFASWLQSWSQWSGAWEAPNSGFQRSNVSVIVANPSWLLSPVFLLSTVGEACRSVASFQVEVSVLDTLREHFQAGDTGGLLEPVYLPPRGKYWKHAAREKGSRVGWGFQVPCVPNPFH